MQEPDDRRGMFISAAAASWKIVFEEFSFAMCHPPSYRLVFLFPTLGLADSSEKRVCLRVPELTPMYTFTYAHTNEVTRGPCAKGSLRKGAVGVFSVSNRARFGNPERGWVPTVGDSRARCPT